MIPGPNETQKQFMARQQSMETALCAFKQKYPNRKLVTIDGFPIYISKKGLHFWESGALWIHEAEDSIRLPLIQLKKKDAETLAHEKVHALRIAFDENRFEEMLAYLTSKKTWRKIWGPLFRTRFSIWTFLFLSVLSTVHPLFILLPISWLSIQIVRMLYDRRKLLRVISKLGRFEYALYLTDREILAFADMTRKQILDYIDEHQKVSFRIYKLKRFMS